MKTKGLRSKLMVAATTLLLIAGSASAQNCDPFVGASVSPPFGSGARTMRICLRQCPPFRGPEPELIVFYSRIQTELSGNPPIDPTAKYGHGMAKFVEVRGGMLVYDYVFPHSGYTDLNPKEFKRIEIPSRRNQNPVGVYYRLGAITTPWTAVCDYYRAQDRFTMPDPITIGIAGDSYVAGEGAPLVTADAAGGRNKPIMWNDHDPDTDTDVACHRSNNSGFAQAVAQTKLNNKTLAITQKFVACAGAKTGNLFSSQQDVQQGINDGPPASACDTFLSESLVQIQFDLIQGWITHAGFSQLDILLLGAGGNDVGFAGIVRDYMIMPTRVIQLVDFLPPQAVWGDFSRDEDAQKKFTDPNDPRYPWNVLQGNYAALQADIGRRFGVLEYNVIIAGYPSPLKGPTGPSNADPWCGIRGIQVPPGLCWGPVEGDDLPPEFHAFHDIIMIKLNGAVATAAQDNKWTFVPMLDTAGRHGLSDCSSGFFNVLGQSMSNQGDCNGAVHPNANGYVQMYKDPLVAAIQGRINAIRALWSSYITDCIPDRVKVTPPPEFDPPKFDPPELFDFAKLISRVRARAAQTTVGPYSYPETYEQFRSRKFGGRYKAAVGDYNLKIQNGTIQLPPANINPNIPGQLQNIDFSEKFAD